MHAISADHPLRRPRDLDVVDLPDPVPAECQKRYDISSSGVECADTHHLLW